MRKGILLFTASLLCIASRAASQSKPGEQEAHIRSIEAKAVDLSLIANEPPLQLSLQNLWSSTKFLDTASRSMGIHYPIYLGGVPVIEEVYAGEQLGVPLSVLVDDHGRVLEIISGFSGDTQKKIAALAGAGAP
jgi:hypothetical protein